MTLEDKADRVVRSVAGPGDLGAAHPIFGGPPIGWLVSAGRMNHFNVFGAIGTGHPEMAEWHNRLQRSSRPIQRASAYPVTLSTDPRHSFQRQPGGPMMAGPFSQWPEPIGLAAIGVGELMRAVRRHRPAGVHRGRVCASRCTRRSTSRPSRAGRDQRHVRRGCRSGRSARRRLHPRVPGPRSGRDSVATMTKHFPGGGPQKDGEDPHFAYGREQVYPGGNFEYHLRPFEAAFAAGAAQIMPYYGMPVGTEYEEVGFGFNESVITGLLRDALGFDGIVCTDWGLVIGLPPETRSTSARSLRQGLGRRAPRPRGAQCSRSSRRVSTSSAARTAPSCSSAWSRPERIAEARIDESARRLLREKFVLGLFEDPFVDESEARSWSERQEFSRPARRRTQSVTLLMNHDAGSGCRSSRSRAGAQGLRRGRTPRGRPPCNVSRRPRRSRRRHGAPRGADRHEFVHLPAGLARSSPRRRSARCLALCGPGPDGDRHLPRATGRPDAFVGAAAAIVGELGVSEAALLEVLFGGLAAGQAALDLPRSEAAVVASRSDVPFDTEDPLFPFGHGLRYRT